MNPQQISSIIGILGFILSICVFILTRWERRKSVVLEMEFGDVVKFLDNEDKVYWMEGDRQTECVIIRVTNIGQRPIVINKSSFVICGNGGIIKTTNVDWYGLNKIPSPVSPNVSFEVAVMFDDFKRVLDEKALQPIMHIDNHDKLTHKLYIEFYDLYGKKFKSKDYAYDFLLGFIYLRPKSIFQRYKNPNYWQFQPTQYL